jgi:putative ABC transport system substrate-binding protein
MDRRAVVKRVACGFVATPFIATAQKPPQPVIGYLSSRSPEESAGHAAAFRRGLGDMGYVDRENVVIEYRWAKGNYESLPSLAAALAKAGVNVLVAVGGTPSALAAKAATGTIPIVFLIGDDPAKIGLVASLSWFRTPASVRFS